MSLSRHTNVETLKTYVDMAKIKKQKIGHSLSIGIETDTPKQETPEKPQPLTPQKKIPDDDVAVADRTHNKDYVSKNGTDKTNTPDEIRIKELELEILKLKQNGNNKQKQDLEYYQ